MPVNHSIPIIDGHNDTVLDLYNNGKGSRRSFFEESSFGHLDLPRARKGGLGGGFFALFTPASAGVADPADTSDAAAQTSPRMSPVGHSDALDFTLGMAAYLFQLERESNGEIAIVHNVDEIERCLADGTLAVIFHIEGAEAIDTNLDALEVLYQAGLRSIGITWSRPNQFGSGVPFAFPSAEVRLMV
jgi:membrane dipeptidase